MSRTNPISPLYRPRAEPEGASAPDTSLLPSSARMPSASSGIVLEPTLLDCLPPGMGISPEDVEQFANLKVAYDVLERCLEFGVESTTNEKALKLPTGVIREVLRRIGEIRCKFPVISTYPNDLQQKDPKRWEEFIQLIKDSKAGNCQEQSFLALATTLAMFPDVKAQRVSLALFKRSEGDKAQKFSTHGYVLIGHEDGNGHTVKDPKPGSVVLDLHSGCVYPEQEMGKLMKICTKLGRHCGIEGAYVEFDKINNVFGEFKVGYSPGLKASELKKIGPDLDFLKKN